MVLIIATFTSSSMADTVLSARGYGFSNVPLALVNLASRFGDVHFGARRYG